MYLGKVHKFVAKVQYKDLDMYSVMYHPNYFQFADDARNQAFADFGYPIEEQLKDQVGFTIGSMNDVVFKRPLFMGETVTIFTEVMKISSRSCEVMHWIELGDKSLEISLDGVDKMVNAVFKAVYTLVFVSTAEINEYPLNALNIKRMKTINFNEKVKTCLGFL